ncbi:MAG: hypothetical protein ACI9LM_001905 [Alteromonadaceae bacterium]|jgi:hypothetical protein
MKNNNNNNKKLANNIRILIGIVALPSLYLAYMITVMTINGSASSVDYFEWVYAFTGFIAIYIAITGKKLF